jgi:pimeloyl-ACP methyl ester carboxylesterase
VVGVAGPCAVRPLSHLAPGPPWSWPHARRAFSYESMAAETATFLETVVGGPPRWVGWSDGGTVALLVAVTRRHSWAIAN